ncbi:MAG: hypothetical protein M1837_002536 [Sclerophora amabilis]|nr:MAG: hypothetical protein M1837_002536 [Sclerophora amabilis]
MSSTSSSSAATSSTPPDILEGAGGKGQQSQGISVNSFLASLGVAAAVFGAQLLLFFSRPKTFLVPEKERIETPASGLLGWIKPTFQTSTSDFIQRCGLDAYFFLRFLRTLLKIFVPLALVILPVLLPINYVRGRGAAFAVGKFRNQKNVTGLDQLGWGNVHPDKTDRYWAHLILAVALVIYVCYVFFDELRGYIRMRQAFLTSPQHRLRASATTVLVTSIPRKWLSVEALDGLYDVFPGGIRNIWINRDFDELSEKVKERDKLALALEGAETDLIKKAKKAHIAALEKEAKRAGAKKSKADRAKKAEEDDANAANMAEGPGTSSGDPHQVRHTLHDAAHEDDVSSTKSKEGRNKFQNRIQGIGSELGAVGHGVGNLGQTVLGGFRKVGKGVDDRLNNTQGLVVDDDRQQVATRDDRLGDGVAPGYHPTGASAGDTHLRGESTAPSGNVVNAEPLGHPAYRARPDMSTAGPSGSEDSSGTPRAAALNESRPYSADVDPRVDGRMSDASPTSPANADQTHQSPSWMFWQRGNKKAGGAQRSDDQAPLKPLPATPRGQGRDTNGLDSAAAKPGTKEKPINPLKVLGVQKEGDSREGEEYPAAFNMGLDGDDDGEPEWKKYLKDKDRDTRRLPPFGKRWMISLPFVGEKVDTIDYCRREVARLNVEIEQDQQHPEKFPLMNSAFIQFHHQVAAHMACQAVSHHLPKQMAPRTVEIAPMDVIWENMSMKWWERYLRTGVALVVVVALILGWAVPVSFTGLLSQLTYLEENYDWLAWIGRIPVWLLSIIQGVLPPAILGLLMVLLPVILRALSKQQGIVTRMGIELSVQKYYFAFSFVQLFLVVSISSGFLSVITKIASNPQGTPSLLASNLPKASNYFFSYMLLQAFSVSAGALVQIGALLAWFVLAPLMDNTARKKWRRVVYLPEMKWGTFFPVYTNLACIGIIYSIISPLIMIFNIITFSLFWIVYRYDTLYVRKFRFDTGGLFYPTAINQLFTGLYVMEICLIGLFFLVRDTNNTVACKGQAIVMIVVTIFTVIFQYLLNEAFGPLFRYLPITLEDNAAARDEEFARAQGKKFGLIEEEQEGDDIQDVLEERERRERLEEAEAEAEEIEMRNINKANQTSKMHPLNVIPVLNKTNWAEKARTQGSADFAHFPSRSQADRTRSNEPARTHEKDVESQRHDPIAERLFGGIHDEIEDLTPDERDALVRRAFQHSALRAKRPVIWLPRDDLGVSDDEIYRTQRLSKHIWISNEYTALDAKTRVVYKRSPPDFSEVDMIDL